MTRRLARLALSAALAFAAGGALAAPSPRVGIASFAQLPTPLPYPYDEQADADAAVAAAKTRAKRTHRLLLVDLGGNWCADCRILAGTLDLPEVRAFVDAHYVVVAVDVGRIDRNLQIPAHYGVMGRLEGVPSLLVVNPRTDALLDRGHTSALSDARYWLAQWTP
jgi:thiol-disulfide isomerase/thioredoxin